MVRKILYSPGYGAGWSTWNPCIDRKLMCEWPALIQAVENKEHLTEDHPAIVSLMAEVKRLHGDEYICLLGMDDLAIATVPDGTMVRINEYDGSESVITGYSDFF